MEKISRRAKQQAANKLNALLQKTANRQEQVLLLQALDMLCEAQRIQMPEDAVSANIGLDEHFRCDVLNMR